jgi:hypothetical protein
MRMKNSLRQASSISRTSGGFSKKTQTMARRLRDKALSAATKCSRRSISSMLGPPGPPWQLTIQTVRISKQALFMDLSYGEISERLFKTFNKAMQTMRMGLSWQADTL